MASNRIDKTIRAPAADTAPGRFRHPTMRAVTTLAASALFVSPAPALAEQFKLGPVTIVPIARLFIDHASYARDRAPLEAETRPTSLRLGAGGSIGSKTRFLLQYELREWFRHEGQGKALRYAFVSYQPNPKLFIDIGQTDQPFGFEAMATSKNSTFLEWSQPIILGPYYHFGAIVGRKWKKGAIVAGYFGKTIAQKFHDPGHGGSVRAFFSPIHTPSSAIHVGGSLALRYPKSEVARFAYTPEAPLANFRLIDTGPIRGVDSTHSYALEAAAIRGPLSVQGEYVHTTANRGSATDVGFDGAYAYVSYILTGEKRAFDPVRGSFGSVTPASKNGAVELAARVSTLDLDDGPIHGGRQTNLTLGANWYVNRHIRLMVNLVSAHSKREGRSDNPTVFQTRLHFEL